MEYEDLTKSIIKSAFRVHRVLGYGFLEKVYENAMLIELRRNGLMVKQQESINVYYDDQIIGEYFADLFVENVIIIELKAASMLAKEHEIQLVNYLTATKINMGLLINFGPSVQVKRKYCTRLT